MKILHGEQRAVVVYDTEIAVKLGVNAAIILSRIIWSIEGHIENGEKKYFRDGRWWMYDSVTNLMKYSTLGRDAVKRALKKLQTLKLLHVTQYDIAHGNCHNWYAIDSDVMAAVLNSPLVQNQPVVDAGEKPTSGIVQNLPTGECKSNYPTGAKPTFLSKSLTKSLTESHDEAPNGASTTSLKMAKKKEFEHTLEDFDLAQTWLAYAKREMKYTTPTKSWTAENFAEALSKVRRVTSIEITKLNEVLKFIEQDDFWKSNVLSPEGLLKKGKNDLRKIDNICLAMKGKKHGATSKGIDYSSNPERYAQFSDDKPW